MTASASAAASSGGGSSGKRGGPIGPMLPPGLGNGGGGGGSDGDEEMMPGPSQATSAAASGRMMSEADRQYERESAADKLALSRASRRTNGRDNSEFELDGSRAVGKERMLENKRAKRDGDKAYRDAKEDGGLDVREDVLMGAGSSDSFRAQLSIGHSEESLG